MPSPSPAVAAYLASLDPERREAIEAVRKVVNDNLSRGYAEGMQYGMIGWFVPHSVYPKGYHCDPKQPLPFAGLASQKQHMSLYLMGLYMVPGETAWFEKAWIKAGRKLDKGKACVRFKKLDDLALGVIAEALRRLPAAKYITAYDAAYGSKHKPALKKKAATKKPAARKKATKKATKKSAKKA